MDQRVAFLVPTHPPHFKYAKSLLETWKVHELDKQSDIWFVLTNDEDAAQFKADERARYLVLPQHLRNPASGGIINIKKFYALSILKDCYEFIIVMDCEAMFVKNVDLKAVCESYWRKKVLLGNRVPFEGKRRTDAIVNSCKKWFAEELSLMPPSQTSSINELYLWFNQPCIYKASTLDDFFQKIHYYSNPVQYTWHDFDYYVYMLYLLCYQGFDIDDMEILSNYGVCDAGVDFLHFKSNKYETLDIYMCSFAALRTFDNPKLFIVCHLDRDDVWMARVTNWKIDDLTRRLDYLSQLLDSLRISYSELLAEKNRENIEWIQKYDMLRGELDRLQDDNSRKSILWKIIQRPLMWTRKRLFRKSSRDKSEAEKAEIQNSALG